MWWVSVLVLSICHLVSSEMCACDPCLCQDVRTIPIDFFKNQPLIYRVMENKPCYSVLDSACSSLLPAPDSPGSYVQYYTTVYQNDTIITWSYVSTQIGPGTLYDASVHETLTEKIIGYAGCNLYVDYLCSVFADLTDCEPYIYLVNLGHAEPITKTCMRKAEQIIRDAGLEVTEWYELTMELPLGCIEDLCWDE